MPILMIALFALAVFGLIGVLLAAAVVLETKKENSGNSPAPDCDLRTGRATRKQSDSGSTHGSLH